MTDTVRTTCSAHIHGSGYVRNYLCPRIAVEDGLCKMHLAVRRRHEANSKELDDDFVYHRKQEAAARTEATRIGDLLGITVRPFWNDAARGTRGFLKRPFSGLVIVSIEELDRLAKNEGLI